MIDQMALHINNDNIESPKKMNLELKQSCCLNSLETEGTWDVDDQGPTLTGRRRRTMSVCSQVNEPYPTC